MGFLDRLFGADASRGPNPDGRRPPPSEDAQAIDRYRYMLRTAPPETLEQAHAEAFAQLTPEQRRQVLAGLVDAAPPGESAAVASTPLDDPKALARAATRAEIRQPGLMERTLGGGGMGMGMGTSLLSSFLLGFAGSMVANSFFSAIGGFDGSGDADPDAEASAEPDETATDDAGGFDDGGGFDGGDVEI